MGLLPILTFATLGAAIAFALWSKWRTERKLESDNDRPSSLARTTPDPRLKPDQSVTDPYGVTKRS